jgi:outer membrane protein W
MKKLSLLVGGLVLSTAVMAQKPTDGAPMSLEGGLGFTASTLNFVAPQIRFRYFVSENIAVRLTVALANSKTTENYYENADGTGGTGTYENKIGNTQFGIGAEYHFAGTEKLSPYAGVNIMFGMGGQVQTWDNAAAGSYSANTARTRTAKTGMFGVALVGGMDYYFAENFYIGAEVGLMFGSSKDKEVTDEVTAPVTATTVTGEVKTTALTTNFTGAFRLGWRF